MTRLDCHTFGSLSLRLSLDTRPSRHIPIVVKVAVDG